MSADGRGRAERPFVDTPVGGVAEAWPLARRAAERLGLGDVRLVRVGMNAVFAAGDVIVRIGRTTAGAATAIGLAERLSAIGVRVPRPVGGDALVDLDGADGALTVTAWERIEPSGDPIDWGRVGAMVARLHREADAAVVGSFPCPSPTRLPWWDFDTLLASADAHVDRAALAGLRSTVERHAWWRTAASADAVVCHGDVHPGNVVQSADGPVLLDWDLLCWAPAGWDHAAMSTLAERWGGPPGEYEDFAAGYGGSRRDDPFAAAVAELRLVAATLMRVRAGEHDPAARREADRRLRYWRGERDAPAWHAQ